MKRKIFIMLCAVVIFIIPPFFFNSYEINQKKIPQVEDVLARKYLKALFLGNFSDAASLMVPKFRTANDINTLRNAISKTIGQSDKVSNFEIVQVLKFLKSNTATYNDSKPKYGYTLGYQFNIDGKWFLAKVTVGDFDNQKLVYGWQLSSLQNSLQKINAFTFFEKPEINFIIFSIGIILILFVLYTVFLWLDVKVKNRWWWLLFILCGVGQLKFNWTSGQFIFHILGFSIPPVSYFRMGIISPYILVLTIPIGAIIFNFKVRKIKKEQSIL